MMGIKKSVVLLLVCLFLPCAVMAEFSVENAKPIIGGDTTDGEVLFSETKYTQVFIGRTCYSQYFKLKAPSDGTYHIRMDKGEGVTPLVIVSNKRSTSWNSGVIYEKITSERVFSFNAKKDEEYSFSFSTTSFLNDEASLVFSICFDGYHTPSIESEVAHYATCSSEGEIIYPCTLCGQPSKTESIPKKPHTLGDWKKESNPGCTTVGLNVQRCTVCNEIVNKQEIPAIGHGTSKQIVTTPATCLANGVMSEQCTVCLETLSTQSIPVTDHTPGIMRTVLAASCTMNGRGEQRCTVCNALLKEETTTAYGHSFSEWETIVEPTKQAEGQKMRYCHNCASVEYEAIEKLPKFLGIF